MPTDLVTIATTAVLTQFLTPAAKNIGEVALERAKQVGTRAASFLAAVGRTPQPVEEKLLLPLVQAASLETNESLADRWAALLANAVDPAKSLVILPAFTDVLRQLTSQDAVVIDRLYVRKHPAYVGGVTRTEMIAYYDLNQALEYQGEFNSALIVDNLKRLQLCDTLDTFLGEGKVYASYIKPTEFGFRFILACCPPIK